MSEAAFVPENYFRELRKDEVFEDASRPLEIDLGCGDGSFLLAMAAQHPERHFLGIERMLGRYDKVARKITQAGLRNVRVLRLESSYTVGWLLPSASVSRLHLLCPDPWPKKKHHRRRLVVGEEFQQGLQRILVPGVSFCSRPTTPITSPPPSSSSTRWQRFKGSTGRTTPLTTRRPILRSNGCVPTAAFIARAGS